MAKLFLGDKHADHSPRLLRLLWVVESGLVGLIGGSNQPISGLALSTLIIAALLMVMFGITGVIFMYFVIAMHANRPDIGRGSFTAYPRDIYL